MREDMEPSYNFPQDDYALAILTHAAMNHPATTAQPKSTSFNNPTSVATTTAPPLDRGRELSNHGLGHFSSSRNINQHPSAHIASLGPSQSQASDILNGYGVEGSQSSRDMTTLAYSPASHRTQPYLSSYHGVGPRMSDYPIAGTSGLGILNAESYDDGRYLNSRDRKAVEKRPGQVMPFGMEQAIDEKTDSHEDEVEKGPRRRKKTSAADQTVEDADEEARKKARGRPRVDTKDETAADRRRTQIRMAQRAYRHRKETTITSLEKQVQDLRGTNEEMSNIFISLYDFAVGKGLLQREPEFGQQLQSTTERFLALAKAGALEDGHEEHNGEDDSKHVESEPGPRPKGLKASPKKRNEDVEQQLLDPVHPWGGYTLSKDDTPEEDLSMEYQSQSYESRGRSSDLQIITRPTEENASFPFDLMDVQQYHVEVPFPEDYSQTFLPVQPPLPVTHAYTEYSFARRIHRATIERAFSLITSKHASPETFERVFGLTLKYESRESLEARLTRAIAKTSRESLHQWNNPFVHIGGSGTFYPNNDSSEDLMRPKLRTGYSMGPFSSSVIEAGELMQDDFRCSLPGFEGEFFDANDVEGYLRGHGLEIPPCADFITAVIDVSVFAESPGSDSSVATISPKTPVSPLTKDAPDTVCEPYNFDFSKPEPKSFPFPALKFGTWDNETLNTTPNTGPIFSTLPDQHPEQHTPESTGSEVPGSEKRLVTINVQTLINEILRKGVCLGRAPGYRPSDVNAAIVAAVSTGF